MTRPTLVLLGLLVCVTPLVAGEATVHLKSGQTFTGELARMSDTEIDLRWRNGGSSMEITIERHRVRPESWAALRLLTATRNPAGLMTLARYCRANGLRAVAEQALRTALARDPKLAKAVAAERALWPKVRQRQLSPGADESRNRRPSVSLPGPERHLAASRRLYLDGIVARPISRARKILDGAIHAAIRGLVELDRLLASRPDEGTRASAAALRKRVIEQAIDAHIALGSKYLYRSSYNRAYQHANHALRLDPKSDAARRFRDHVAFAAAVSHRHY